MIKQYLTYMEYIAGRNLEELLDTNMVKDKAKVITGLNNILTILKRNTIVHGDLLPHNFIITTDDDDDYCVRVVDFDWAGEESKCTYPPPPPPPPLHQYGITMAFWSSSWIADYTSA